MATRSFQFVSNEFYHIYNRGVEKRIIYLDIDDYRRFTELLYVSNTSAPTDLREIKRDHEDVYGWDRGNSLVAIGAYCLMPNHFHILLTPLQENGVSIFMNKLCTSYSMYFNRRYKRTGGLFQGKFKAKHANSDEYLKYLYSYIHLNPVKLFQSDWKEQGIQDKDKAYQYAVSFLYSSLVDYVGPSRAEYKIINPMSFPDYFNNHADLKTELMEWLKYEE